MNRILKYFKKSEASFSLKNLGFSIVDMLLLFGTISIIAYTTTSMFMSHLYEQKRIEKKIFAGVLEQNIRNILGREEVCSCHFTGLSFDSDNLPDMSIVITEPLRVSCDDTSKIIAQAGSIVSDTKTQLQVMKMKLKNFSEVSTDKYSAELEVSFNNFDTPIAPIKVSQFFKTDAAATTKTITSCTSKH